MQAPPKAPPVAIVKIPVLAGPPGPRTGDVVTVKDVPVVTYRRC